MHFLVDQIRQIVFHRAPERRFGGIGRRARLKIEYLRVWVRVPQPLLFGVKWLTFVVGFFVCYAKVTQT